MPGESQMAALKFSSMAKELRRMGRALEDVPSQEAVHELQEELTNERENSLALQNTCHSLREDITNLKKDLRAREAKIRRLEKKLNDSDS